MIPIKKKPTIAQKKANPKKRRFRDILPWIICPPLALLAFFLKFIAPGYGFSALVCCILIFIIVFYAVTAHLSWGWVPAVRKIFTVCLILGLIVVAITEAVIIKASFGSPRESVDYIVVLGAKVRETGPSASLWDRIYGAYDYLEAHPNVVAIVSGGQGPDEPITEAKAMRDALVNLGIDPSRIWLEEKATNTYENIHFALDIIAEKNGQHPRKLGVVSSEYHLFRASLFTEKNGVEFVGIPARTSRPSQMINHFMREVAGVWYFWILGGQYDA